MRCHRISKQGLLHKQTLIFLFRNFSWLETHDKNHKAKEAHTREANMKVNMDANMMTKVGENSMKDLAMSSVVSTSESSQKLSTLTPN
jgi:hypothetical protein